MRTFLFLLSSTVAVLILLLNDSRQLPVGPSFSYARQGLNLVAAAQGNQDILQQAIDSFYEALRMDEKDPLALFGMGWALQSRGFNDEARSYYGKALEQLKELEHYTVHNLSILPLPTGVSQGLIPSSPVSPDSQQAEESTP